MSAERLGLVSPHWLKIVLDKAGLREITPEDICTSDTQRAKLFEKYPMIAGDSTAIGPGDDGNCQDWRGDPGWWKGLLKIEGEIDY